jgi:chaperonin GroES
MKIRPLHDWAVIKRVDAGEKTAGGIIIPATARKKSAEGIVEAVGPGKYTTQGREKKEKFVPTTVKPGQRIIFTDFSARDVEVDRREITLVREEDILGIYEAGKHLAVKELHPAPVPSQRGNAAATSGEVKKAARKKAFKEATKPADRKESKPGKTIAKKKTSAAGKEKEATKKSATKSAKKTVQKMSAGKGAAKRRK